MKWFGHKGSGQSGALTGFLKGSKAARGTGRPFLFSAWRPSGWFGTGAALAAEPWPRGYEAQVREAYLGNPVAQRAVRLVAESVAWAPVYALDGETAGSTGSARRSLGHAGLLETVATQLLLHGNAFVQMLQDARRRCRPSCSRCGPSG